MKKILVWLTVWAVWIHGCPLLAQDVDAAGKAHQHPIVLNKPAVNFFEGAVLGNGGMGVVVVTRPDAILFHFGHNNVWDIRIQENHRDEIGTFEDVMKRVQALPPDVKAIRADKGFKDYLVTAADNFNKPYPRPFPCGTVILGFDRRKVEVLGHKLDIANGLCEVYLLNKGVKNTLEVFTDMDSDVLWFRLVDENKQALPSCFNRFRVLPDSETPKEFPEYIHIATPTSLGFQQTLPYLTPDKYDMQKGHPKDKAFRIEARLNATLADGFVRYDWGIPTPLLPLERSIVQDDKPFFGHVVLTEGLASEIESKQKEAPAPEIAGYQAARNKSDANWKAYWEKSGIELADTFLEALWYRNHYFLNCAVKAGVSCPGLYANWSLGKIGTEWHGDYTLNYNTQQPFWVLFSSNRLEKNQSYVDLVYHILPVAKRWAKEYYGMRGASFPHNAYPVDMTLNPYPVPTWGWEVFETPWATQGLWWHYLYSMDVDFLKNRAFEPIKEAVLFLVDFIKRPDTHGPQWNDNKYHIFPSIPPELYGLQPGFKLNHDTQADITLTKFIFKAFIEAVDVLKYNKQEAALLKDVKLILENLPAYSTIESEQYGTIYTSVPGEVDDIVYNCPANLMHIFPGEEFGIDAPADIYRTLVNTYRAHQNEGGNEIVFQNLQAARLGILDIEKFKRQVNYALLPNQTVANMILQQGGRYADNKPYDWMAPFGIWFENFSLPVVINECLMQSYDGTIRLFPNWDKKSDAEFSTLRAIGAFLISCKLTEGNIAYLRILSEKGSLCKLKNPWGNDPVQLVRNGKPAETLSGELLTFKTSVNEKIEIQHTDRTYSNPVITRSVPDPTIVRHSDGYFYLYATEDTRNVPIFRSSDLISWQLVGTAFTNATRPNFEPGGGIWAPDISFINGQYVLYYSMSVWGGERTCGIGRATAPNPEGPFTDLGMLFRSNTIDVQNSIDPFYMEEDGKKYLFWGSFSGLYGIELSEDGLNVKEGASKQLIAGTAYEGTYIHKRGNYYYLFASIGSCCEGLKSTYTTVVGRSKHLFGPYTDKKRQKMLDNHHEIVIHKNSSFVGVGHNSEIVQDDNGSDWILYHGYRASDGRGRLLLLDKIVWENDWPTVAGGSPSTTAERPVFLVHK